MNNDSSNYPLGAKFYLFTPLAVVNAQRVGATDTIHLDLGFGGALQLEGGTIYSGLQVNNQFQVQQADQVVAKLREAAAAVETVAARMRAAASVLT